MVWVLVLLKALEVSYTPLPLDSPLSLIRRYRSSVRRLLDSLTKKQGAKYDSPASRRDIAPFIEFHNLDINEVLDPLPSFREASSLSSSIHRMLIALSPETFNEFFYRKLKPEVRPLDDPNDPRTIVSPADVRSRYYLKQG